MDFFPIFLHLKGKRCLVVGGGEVAARKTGLLLQAGANVSVVAPELGNTLSRLTAEGAVDYRPTHFSLDDIGEAAVIIAATNDETVNQEVSRAAQQRNIPVNVVDNPALCSFIMPSIIDRSPIMVAVSSGGASPVLARLLRARLETLIPSAYSRLAKLTQRFRDTVKRHFTAPAMRRMFWEKVLQGSVAELVFSGQDDKAEALLQAQLAAEAGGSVPQGEVYLVGGGPGNPDLLTFRALRLMQQADVIVYDHLVSPEVLELA
ncbi:MAG TPA: siroheme synthase, partial [Betaproteobacteria bacterium]|nr:siroheme synthase [Betaproteobacteria bacterium]